MLSAERIALLKHGAPPRNALEAALRNVWYGGGGASYEKTVGPAPIISISDAKAKPAKSLIVGMEPIQDLHGYDSPWPAGGGKNKFDKTTIEPNKYINSSGSISGSSGWSVSDYIPVTENTNYTLSGTGNKGSAAYHAFFNSSKSYMSVVLSTTTAITVPSGASYIRISMIDVDTTQLEQGETATAYAPYSNECPISGRTGVTVDHSGADTSDPQTYPVVFPDAVGTVYGGTVDVVSGVLTVTDAEIASYNGETLPSTWISDRDVYAEGTTPTIGAQVVYELATPQTYQLTPQQIQLLKGSNTLWSDGDSLTLTYLGTTPANLLGGMLGGGFGGAQEPIEETSEESEEQNEEPTEEPTEGEDE